MIIHHSNSAAVKRKYQGLRRQFLIDENSEGEVMSDEMAKKKKYQARIYRVKLPVNLSILVRSNFNRNTRIEGI